MSKTENQGSVSRKRYSAEYKAETLTLAERIGVSAAARELGLHDSQLYAWRTKAQLERDRSAVERELAAENVRLKRQLSEQAEELAIVKNVWSAPKAQVDCAHGVEAFASMYPACWRSWLTPGLDGIRAHRSS